MMSVSLLNGKIRARNVLLFGIAAVAAGAASLPAQYGYRVVPGRGQKVTQVGDDFEEAEWGYHMNTPKASANIDSDDRLPAGISKNNRVYESTYRGQPDVITLIDTPPGGLPGSKHALKLRSSQTGIPGRPSFKMQQDDLLINLSSVIGPVSVSMNPSIVVRVFLPPFEYWEKRTGASFGFRAELEATTWDTLASPPRRGLFSRIGRRRINKQEAYWPGFFIQFNSKTDRVNKEDSALLLIRCGDRGEDIIGPKITQTGWWTLGMAFTSDGMTHFYASPGVDPLTEKDHLATTRPYGHSAEKLNTFFFNVVCQDDGRSWSTEWVVDDPTLYYHTR